MDSLEPFPKTQTQLMQTQQTHFMTSQPAFTCSKLTIGTLEQGVKYVQWRRSGIFIVNFEHISHLVLLFLLLTLNM